MKKRLVTLVQFLVAAFFSTTFLTGCGLNSLSSLTGSTKSTENLLNGELAAIEGALVANRLQAITEFTSSGAGILVTATDGWTRFPFRGKTFSGKDASRSAKVLRAANGCPVTLVDGGTASNTVVLVGTETCRLEQTGSNSYRLSRANGNAFTVTPSATTSAGITLRVKEVDWIVTFPEGSAEPLFRIKSVSGERQLTVSEADDGSLSLTTQTGASFYGGWSPEGILALVENSSDAKVLYRAGQWYYPGS